MGFLRTFKNQSINIMFAGKNGELFERLKADILLGNVFPAIRVNELHFYYKGGCLYKFVGGSFKRDKNYERFSKNTEGLSPYEKAKKQNENKFTNKKGEITERQLLDKLYCYTYNSNLKSNVVVLDIEVNLNGNMGWGKKCDLVLLNTETDEIMFVEGKVFSDTRVKCVYGTMPEVIEQVSIYSAAVAEQQQNIIEQYSEYIRIINCLFGTTYRAPQKLIEPAKLLVYETISQSLTDNGRYSIDTVNAKLGKENVMWVEKGNEPALEEIWNALSGATCR